MRYFCSDDLANNNSRRRTFTKKLDHCVQLTGYNLTAPEPYYLVRNSWATNWGEDGYILLSATGNTCGLADEATFVDVVVGEV